MTTDPTPRTAATARLGPDHIRYALVRQAGWTEDEANAALAAAEAPGRVAVERCERTHWDGTVLLSERNHYLAGCPCPQGPWCVPHGWSGTDAEHHAICAGHEHVAAAEAPAGVSGEVEALMDKARRWKAKGMFTESEWAAVMAVFYVEDVRALTEEEAERFGVIASNLAAPAPTPSEPVER